MEFKYIAKRYWEDKSTPMGQSDVKAKAYHDVIDLSLGDPDQVTDRLIIDSAFEDARSGHTKYTDFRGDLQLRAAIGKDYKDTYGIDVKDEEIMVTTSGCLAMYLALESIIDPGDEVIVQAPYFTPYPQQVELAGGVAVALDTYEEENFQINVGRLERLVTDRTKAIIINTPNNPTGACLTRETYEGIARIADQYDLLVIADDIYTLFSYQEPFTPFMSVENMRKRTITINSFSKDYIMTGWRVGYMIAPEEIIRTAQLINENVVFTAPSISQRAAIHALYNKKAVQSKILAIYKERMFHAYELIKDTRNMSVLPPMGTFYLFVNIKKTGLTSAKVADLILEEAHVLTLPGYAFGTCGEGYIRITCTVDNSIMDEAFRRIRKMKLFAPQ